MAVYATQMPLQPDSLYEVDFFEWCHKTANLLREGRWENIELEHLVEEIKALAGRDEREIYNRLVVLVMHLLKWHAQSAYRCQSWRNTIVEQRRKIELILEQSPSLKGRAQHRWAYLYARALNKAVAETGFAERQFPAECPWTPEQVLDPQFYPEAAE